MKEFCYYETRPISLKKAIREKWLLVKDENNELQVKYNLTQMGLEYINSYAELLEVLPADHYDYDKDR